MGKNYIIIAPRGLSDEDVNNGEIWKTYNSWTFPGSSSGVGPSENGPKPICAKPSAIGTTNGYNYNSCEGQDGKNENKCAWTHCGSDDIGFVQALLTETKKELCVDEANVFAAGGSNGGMFTWGLGQNSATAPLFRAIAPLIGLPHRGYADGKGKAASLPVLLITGMRDKVVPPGNWNKIAPTKSNDKVGFMYESATKMTKLWSEQAGCDVSRRPRKVKRRIFRAGKGIQCRAWCSSGSDIPVPWVIDCRGGKMGHVYKLSQTFKMMVTFFDAHSAPASDESFS